MEYTKLIELLNKNKHEILSNKVLRTVLDKGNGLIGIEAINRILIALQRDDCTDVCYADEVEILGNKIDSNAVPIYIIGTKRDKVYIDCNTGSIADTSDLNIKEMQKAIELGIIKQDEVVTGYNTIALIDKRDIISENCSEMISNKSKLNYNEILEIFKEITGADIIETDKMLYDIKSNKLFIHDGEDTEVLSIVADGLYGYIKRNTLETIIKNQTNKQMSDNDQELLEQIIEYEIRTALGLKEEVEFATGYIAKYDELIEIINIADIATYDIIISISKNKTTMIINPEEVAKKISQCTDMLMAMQANSIYAKLMSSQLSNNK